MFIKITQSINYYKASLNFTLFRQANTHFNLFSIKNIVIFTSHKRLRSRQSYKKMPFYTFLGRS